MPLLQIEAGQLVGELPFGPDQSPPVWVVGSGMTVTSGDIVGIAGTRDLALRLLARWTSKIGPHPSKEARAKETGVRVHLPKPETGV